MSNGAIVARVDGPLGLRTVSGELGRLPADEEPYSAVAFTADGSEIVYSNVQHEMAAVEVDTGATRILGDCNQTVCDGALAPDGRRLATGDRDGVRILTLDTGRTVVVPTPGTDGADFPRWSPDGQQIAFLSEHGICVMGADGTDLRRVHATGNGVGDPRAFPPPSWAPDGRMLAFLEATPRRAEPTPPYDFKVMTVRADGSGLTSVHAAGHCYCLGLPGPALAWSPDGELIAVAVSQMKGGPGVFLVAPDGSGWKQLASAVYGTTIAWQPVTE